MMNKRRHRRLRRRKLQLSPPGADPGIVLTDPEALTPLIDLILYNEHEFTEDRLSQISLVREHIEGPLAPKQSTIWLNIDGLGEAAMIQEVGDIFGFHKLALEDVVNVQQRAKLENYKDHQFLVTRIISYQERLESEQLSIFLGSRYIVTFQEIPGDCFDPVRTRLRAGQTKIREAGPDYLMYSLLDSVIDSYFPVLEKLGEKMETLEVEILSGRSPQFLGELHALKRDLLTLRRAVWPLREIVNSLIRDTNPLISEQTRFYLRDCYDHVARIMDLVEMYRELAADLMDLYLSVVSHKMNEVIKVLTVISTIFIPLTFIVGVYGMNFDPASSPYNMPELRAYYGYPLVWAAMILFVVLLTLFFKRKGWIGQETKILVPQSSEN